MQSQYNSPSLHIKLGILKNFVECYKKNIKFSEVKIK
jgi:hypothetical protein